MKTRLIKLLKNIGGGNNPPKVVLDTNILVSALLFGGKPRNVLELVRLKKIAAFTSLILLAELIDVLTKKFGFSQEMLKIYLLKLQKHLIIIQPRTEIHVLKDEADNRILETAREAKCKFIITGDKEFLKLEEYEGIKIISVEDFCSLAKQYAV